MSLTPNTMLQNRYRIEKMLAQGGMGAIYRGYDVNLDISVAIKENFFHTPQSIKQFKQEARILARLHNPGLPRVIDHFEFNGQQYLVMDFIDGHDLWQMMKVAQRPFNEVQALDFIIQVCEAVNYLHHQKPPIIHRDIKPQNIKVTPEGRAVLVDFGIAKVGGSDDRTRTGAQGVTPGFSPPEQYSGTGTTPASDVYALGATLYALLTARKPPDSVSLMMGQTKFIAPNQINAQVSRGVSQAIGHAMQPQPAQRPQTVKIWQEQLKAVSASASDNQTTFRGPTVSPGPLTYWLVDSMGLGYQIGSQPLTLGRHSNSDVVLQDHLASRHHAEIRFDGRQCLVKDCGSSNGTRLNKQRLGSEWQPLRPGDVLTIGSTAFRLTAEQPTRLAPVKSTVPPTPLTDELGTHLNPKMGQPAPPTSSADILAYGSLTPEIGRPVPSAKPSTSKLPLAIAALMILIAVVVAAGIYLYFGNSSSDSIANEAIIAPTETPTPVPATPTPEAIADVVIGEPTLPIVNTATPTNTASPTATSTNLPSATPVPSTVTVSPTETPLPTATPTATEPPTPSGPTPIPVNAEEVISVIGSREVTDVDLNPHNPQEVYVLVKGNGIYKSSNGHRGPWEKLPIEGGGITQFVIDPSNPTRFYAPSWNAVLRSNDGGNSWQALTNGLSSANGSVNIVTVDPRRPNILYGNIRSSFIVSENGGQSWVSDGFGNNLGQGRLTSIVVDPFNSDVVYAAGEIGSIYKSVDSGRNFKQLAFMVGKGVYSLVAHPTQPDVLIAGINSPDAGIIKTTNGADFVSISNGLVFGGADSAYSALAFAPSNPAIIYAGSGYESDRDAKGIFKSTNSGQQWHKMSHGLRINGTTGQPHYVKSIVVHPTNPNIAWAATGSGLYQTTNGGATWQLQ